MDKILTTILLLILPTIAFAADIYIDPDWTGTESGTYAEPYNSWSDFTVSAGNDYRQKCGTTYTGTITVTATGTSGNYILLGAYQSDGTHEDDSPTFGDECGDAAKKPIIQNSINQSANDGNWQYGVTTDSSTTPQYLEINSLSFQNTENAIRIRRPNNIVRYCYIYEVYWGIRVKSNGDDVLIEQNHIDTDPLVTPPSTETGGLYVDCIELDGPSNAIVRDNVLEDYDHSGVLCYNCSSALIERNKCIGSGLTTEDSCLNLNNSASNNVLRYNYSDNGGLGLSIFGGDSNEAYYNVFVCNTQTFPANYGGCIQIAPNNAYSANNNLVYNNTVYDNDDNSDNRGIHLYTDSNDTGTVSGTEVKNNIVQKISGAALRVSDNSGTISSYTWENNFGYDRGTNFATIEGSNYTTDTAFNARADAADNDDSDPGMTAPATDDFTLSSGAAAIDAGQDLGAEYDEALDPSCTDFTTSPITICTKDQDLSGAAWDVGAFVKVGPVLSGLSPTSQQECGSDPQTVSLSFTSDVNAYCRESTNVAHTTYTDMSNQIDNGEGTTSHNEDFSQACDGLTLHYIICNTAANGSGDSSARYEITIDVAAAGGATVPPTSIKRGNGSTITYSQGGVTISN